MGTHDEAIARLEEFRKQYRSYLAYYEELYRNGSPSPAGRRGLDVARQPLSEALPGVIQLVQAAEQDARSLNGMPFNPGMSGMVLDALGRAIGAYKGGLVRVPVPEASRPESVIFIDPQEALRAVTTLRKELGKLRGTVRVCDPYLAVETIEHLDGAPVCSPLRLLTSRVHTSGALSRAFAALKMNNPEFEVRQVGEKALHDRYIIDDEKMVLLGSSLNAFGSKESFMIRVVDPDTRRSVLERFDAHWSAATPWVP